MRARSKLLAAGAGMLVALGSVVPLARAQETQKITIKTTTGSVELSAGKATPAMLGVKLYPGATIRGENAPDFALKKMHQSDVQDSIRLRAMTFDSTDAPSKVVEFYRKEMAKLGTVLECRAGAEVRVKGQGAASNDGLSCESEGSKDPNATILKVGSEKDQRSVSIKATDAGTEITISRLELSWNNKDTL